MSAVEGRTEVRIIYSNPFLDELRKLGWVEGTTVVIERKDPDYRLDQLPAPDRKVSEHRSSVAQLTGCSGGNLTGVATMDRSDFGGKLALRLPRRPDVHHPPDH
jgi:hypothetical protein